MVAQDVLWVSLQLWVLLEPTEAGAYKTQAVREVAWCERSGVYIYYKRGDWAPQSENAIRGVTTAANCRNNGEKAKLMTLADKKFELCNTLSTVKEESKKRIEKISSAKFPCVQAKILARLVVGKSVEALDVFVNLILTKPFPYWFRDGILLQSVVISENVGNISSVCATSAEWQGPVHSDASDMDSNYINTPKHLLSRPHTAPAKEPGVLKNKKDRVFYWYFHPCILALVMWCR